MSGRILLVEDDESLREVMTFNLEDAGFQVTACPDASAALETFDPETCDCMITDIRMPGMSGLELLEVILERDPQAVVVVVTAYGNKDRAVEAMRLGAFHYVEKPVNNLALQAVIEKAVEHRRFARENRQLKAGAGPKPTIVAASPAMNEVLRTVDKVAASDATILIRGESGTGKELVARAIHDRSDRASRPFVTVNCAAIPADLLESTLFGHKKGAFTGATSASEGKFSAADGGTLFLDEIGEMPMALQSKLLRVLQQGEIDVVGSATPKRVDVRIVAATHQNIERLVKADAFREDLYYRLNVVPIRIPPLRERREDIPVLLRFFLRQYAPDAALSVSEEVDEVMLEYDWPGNVRELQNTVERMSLLRDSDTIALSDVPDSLRNANRPTRSFASGTSDALPFTLPDNELDLRELEKSIIEAALAKHDGNQSATARYLKIPRHVLLYRLEKFEIDTNTP
ncbi:MAG: sigma-54-dependent transcriptional regulator [Myxococcota bacterium]